MELGMEYARKCNADLLLATKPDCDSVGIAVKTTDGEYELLTGNQTGTLLLDYICRQRVKMCIRDSADGKYEVEISVPSITDTMENIQLVAYSKEDAKKWQIVDPVSYTHLDVYKRQTVS